MSRRYAKGRRAWGECQRSGKRVPYRDLVEDGHIPGLLVAPDWWEPEHPQETPVRADDPIALYRPSPEISVPPGEGQTSATCLCEPDAGFTPDTTLAGNLSGGEFDVGINDALVVDANLTILIQRDDNSWFCGELAVPIRCTPTYSVKLKYPYVGGPASAGNSVFVGDLSNLIFGATVAPAAVNIQTSADTDNAATLTATPFGGCPPYLYQWEWLTQPDPLITIDATATASTNIDVGSVPDGPYSGVLRVTVTDTGNPVQTVTVDVPVELTVGVFAPQNTAFITIGGSAGTVDIASIYVDIRDPDTFVATSVNNDPAAFPTAPFIVTSLEDPGSPTPSELAGTFEEFNVIGSIYDNGWWVVLNGNLNNLTNRRPYLCYSQSGQSGTFQVIELPDFPTAGLGTTYFSSLLYWSATRINGQIVITGYNGYCAYHTGDPLVPGNWTASRAAGLLNEVGYDMRTRSYIPSLGTHFWWHDDEERFYTSSDGITWSAGPVIFTGTEAIIFAPREANNGRLVVGGYNGSVSCMYVSDDDGVSWQEKSLPGDWPVGTNCRAIEVLPDGRILTMSLATTAAYFAISSDNGDTWSRAGGITADSGAAGLTYSPTYGLLFASRQGSGGTKLKVNTSLTFSQPSGSEWVEYNPFTPLNMYGGGPAPYVTRAWDSLTYGGNMR